MSTEDNRMTQKSCLYPTCSTDSIIYIIQRKSNQNQSTKEKSEAINRRKRCTRLAAASDQVYQLLAYAR